MFVEFHVVATTSELDERSQIHIALMGEEILLCRDRENYYAVSYYCSHAAFALEGGFIRHGCITCPYHGAEFNLADGAVLAPPAFDPIKSYPLRIEAGQIAIGIASG